MERTVEYLIVHDTGATLPSPPAADAVRPVPWQSAFDDFHHGLRETLWSTKSALDRIPEAVYFALRDATFPINVPGVGRTNRDSLKLDETLQAAGVWEHLTGLAAAQPRKPAELCFVDLCGGPGSFSQVLFHKCSRGKLALSGVGMTLKEFHTAKYDRSEWFNDLIRNKKFMATFGTDGTGNVNKTENLHALRSIVKNMPVRLVVSDGNVDLPFDLANFQETLHARLIFSQWLAALLVLKPTGCMVLKLVDMFSPFTRSVVYLSSFLFRRLQIVKPRHSRAVNSARFLVGIDFQGVPCEWLELLLHAHLRCFTDELLVETFVAADVMARDVAFMESFEAAVAEIARNQIASINLILAAEAAQRQPQEKEEAAFSINTGAAEEFA
jgi:cap1 methyltransferase